MSFHLACATVMPGCEETFEAEDREQLMGDLARHLSDEHDISPLSPEIANTAQRRITEA